MSDTLLKIEQLTYEYKDGTHALQGINLDIKKGEKVALLGPNGAGKSTLFLCINGIHKPKSGLLSLEDNPYQYSKKGLTQIRSQVGIVFQEPDHQLFSANVFDEIAFGPFNLGFSNDLVHKRVTDTINELEITPFQDKPTHFLSGGQKKQVSIADIIVMEPKLLIFDEPTASLDAKHCSMVQNRIDTLNKQGITILLSTHDIDYAFSWADRIIILKDGMIEKSGTPEEIFSDLPLLERTNLKQPTVLQVFHKLQQKGLLPDGITPPRNTSDLLHIMEISIA